MIEINLLPESMRKEKKEWPKEILLFFIGGFLIGILILAWIFSSIQIIVVNGRLSHLEREWKELLPVTEETSALMEKKQQLEERVMIVETLTKGRLLWAKKLNQLSNLIPEGVWLSSISLESKVEMVPSKQPVKAKGKGGSDETQAQASVSMEKKETKVLVIRGSTVSLKKGEEIVDLVGAFINRMKEDESFFKDFSSIELGPGQRGAIGGVDIWNFELSLPFRKNP